MTVAFQSGYSLPGGDQPLKHARIVHSRNWKAGGTVAASTTAAGYFDTAPTNSLTYEKWKPTAIAATWEYNHGSATTVDSCCIAAHTMGTSGNTFTVQYWTGAAWSTKATVTPTDDSPIMAIFTPQSAQRWRLNITAGAAPEIGVVRFAQALQMPRPFYGGHTPIDFGRQVLLRANYSETGEFLGRTRQRVQLATGVSWEHLPESWINANMASLQKAIEAEPFFIAWRPEVSGVVGYAQVDEVPSPETMGIRDLYSLDMSIRALAFD